ncbi:MAG: hypothetical protein ACJ75J_17015 [Cytophagaceae bacterium]
MKHIFFLILILVHAATEAQQVRKEFRSEDIDASTLEHLRKEFGNRKTIPAAYEKQALLALSFYPELKKIHIEFRERKLSSTLKAYPTGVSSIVRSKTRRCYVVAICTDYSEGMSPVTFDKLPFNAQVGILGHELGHIAYFLGKGRLGMLTMAIANSSTKRTDQFEYMTDSIAIAHGLGWQLLDWSEFIRKTLGVKSYRGIQYYLKAKAKGKTPSDKEKYMNPATIRKYMRENPLYRQN